MGKRKTKRKPAPKKKLVLDTQFDCIACNNEKCVDVKMQRDAKVGNLNCRLCGIKFQSPINPLSDPVDVYYEWVDASQANKPEDSRRGSADLSDEELNYHDKDLRDISDVEDDGRLRGRGISPGFVDDEEEYD
ncbi:15095_t:CDS:2 [Funneliformis geosporum]|uniref:Transcription elongation factor 1 homolog n=1 Tax=Funneliformis geosporum TaxID=1117311 RepID=A0A9W4X296_9GLOM|nr:15095_t:CDS:2 [Funneliformis geosporum]